MVHLENQRKTIVNSWVRCLENSEMAKNRWFLGVADTNDVIQKIEKTLNNTHTTTQKLTNNSFRNTKKHPKNTILVIINPVFVLYTGSYHYIRFHSRGDRGRTGL